MNFENLKRLYPRNNYDPISRKKIDGGGGRLPVKLSLHPKVVDKLNDALDGRVSRYRSPFVALTIELAYYVFVPVAPVLGLADKIARVYDGDLLLLATKFDELAREFEEMAWQEAQRERAD